MLKDKMGKLTDIFAEHALVAAYLFGSQVEGCSDSMSNIDLGVLFGQRHPSITEILSLQADLQHTFATIKVDLILLEKARNNVAYSAISSGKLIYTTNYKVRLDFEEKVLRIYHDFTPFMDRFYRDVEYSVLAGDSID